MLEARHGVHALEIVQLFSGTIHLLVTDVVMPEMNGRELAERLKTTSPGTRVLYTSGYTNDDILRRRALDQETDRLLQKPFTSNGLAKAVREALDATIGARSDADRRGPSQR